MASKWSLFPLDKFLSILLIYVDFCHSNNKFYLSFLNSAVLPYSIRCKVPDQLQRPVYCCMDVLLYFNPEGQKVNLCLTFSPFLCGRHRNRIHGIEASQLEPYVSLETLDLSSNNITEIRSDCFPVGLPIKDL